MKKILKKLIFMGVLGFITLVSLNSKVYAAAEVSRIEGNNRFETSIAISKNGWEKSDYAVLANGMNFPDALSAGPLAAKYNAPIILVNSKQLDTMATEELNRLGVKKVFIIGGTGVISKDIEDKLHILNIQTDRYWGHDRFDTAVEVAKRLDNFNEIVITNGLGFADALSIAPIAGKKGIPILLTSKDSLPKVVMDFLQKKTNNNLGSLKTYMVGGPGVVSNTVEKQFPNCERLYGQGRYETNTAVLNRFSEDINFNNIYIASGQDFPDALSGSALAQKNSSGIILSNKIISSTTEKFVKSKLDLVEKINIIGGKGVFLDSNIDDILYIKNGGNSEGNTINLGLVVKDGDWIYHKNTKNGYIFKSKGDENVSTQVNSDDSYYINVAGDWIYYINNEGYIYKITVNGKDKTKLNNTPVEYMKVEGNYIYYVQRDGTKNYKIYRMNLDGSNEEFIDNTNAVSINVVGDWIYYSDGILGNIYKFNVNDKDNKIKITEDSVGFINVSGDWIYYGNISDGGKIYKIKADGSARAKVTDDAAGYINVSGDYIYYLNISDNSQLYKVKTDGSEKKKIGDEAVNLINVAGGWVYYLNNDVEFCRVRTDGTTRQLVK